jgi:2-C-methyl-D-erythritol 2,4-cyclodiphosphate synthase
MHIGIGYDVHRLVKDRKLILGGIEIPFAKGLLGHSDADVLIHAVCDALLGAAGSGDIGRHFPDTDPEFEGISSMELLQRVHKIIHAKGFSVINVDTTILAEIPKLKPYLESMQKNIARILGIKQSSVNIKATTTEGLGIIGKGEGIASLSVALID